MLAPLTDLVGECGQTKTTKAKGSKKASWHWDENHQQAFDLVKTTIDTIARDVVLAYPDYSERFEIYADASQSQIGSVITQNNRPLTFFSRGCSPKLPPRIFGIEREHTSQGWRGEVQRIQSENGKFWQRLISAR